SDDGPGIPESQLPHIFDPFYSTRRSAGGTGLGLSISHRIVTAHGGELRALSDPRSGATFSIELPTSDSVLKLATLEAEERPDGNSSSSG
ncbi:MAG TPA: HAMP domain-containing sensor histidine kinase, partial [Polyangiaceae bacterium]|nr:HAMP domain-containing sensor histidine kinase [Polyangiaceae bacterium]